MHFRFVYCGLYVIIGLVCVNGQSEVPVWSMQRWGSQTATESNWADRAAAGSDPYSQYHQSQYASSPPTPSYDSFGSLSGQYSNVANQNAVPAEQTAYQQPHDAQPQTSGTSRVEVGHDRQVVYGADNSIHIQFKGRSRPSPSGGGQDLYQPNSQFEYQTAGSSNALSGRQSVPSAQYQSQSQQNQNSYPTPSTYNGQQNVQSRVYQQQSDIQSLNTQQQNLQPMIYEQHTNNQPANAQEIAQQRVYQQQNSFQSANAGDYLAQSGAYQQQKNSVQPEITRQIPQPSIYQQSANIGEQIVQPDTYQQKNSIQPEITRQMPQPSIYQQSAKIGEQIAQPETYQQKNSIQPTISGNQGAESRQYQQLQDGIQSQGSQNAGAASTAAWNKAYILQAFLDRQQELKRLNTLTVEDLQPYPQSPNLTPTKTQNVYQSKPKLQAASGATETGQTETVHRNSVNKFLSYIQPKPTVSNVGTSTQRQIPQIQLGFGDSNFKTALQRSMANQAQLYVQPKTTRSSIIRKLPKNIVGKPQDVHAIGGAVTQGYGMKQTIRNSAAKKPRLFNFQQFEVTTNAGPIRHDYKVKPVAPLPQHVAGTNIAPKRALVAEQNQIYQSQVPPTVSTKTKAVEQKKLNEKVKSNVWKVVSSFLKTQSLSDLKALMKSPTLLSSLKGLKGDANNVDPKPTPSKPAVHRPKPQIQTQKPSKSTLNSPSNVQQLWGGGSQGRQAASNQYKAWTGGNDASQAVETQQQVWTGTSGNNKAAVHSEPLTGASGSSQTAVPSPQQQAWSRNSVNNQAMERSEPWTGASGPSQTGLPSPQQQAWSRNSVSNQATAQSDPWTGANGPNQAVPSDQQQAWSRNSVSNQATAQSESWTGARGSSQEAVPSPQQQAWSRNSVSNQVVAQSEPWTGASGQNQAAVPSTHQAWSSNGVNNQATAQSRAWTGGIGINEAVSVAQQHGWSGSTGNNQAAAVKSEPWTDSQVEQQQAWARNTRNNQVTGTQHQAMTGGDSNRYQTMGLQQQASSHTAGRNQAVGSQTQEWSGGREFSQSASQTQSQSWPGVRDLNQQGQSASQVQDMSRRKEYNQAVASQPQYNTVNGAMSSTGHRPSDVQPVSRAGGISVSFPGDKKAEVNRPFASSSSHFSSVSAGSFSDIREPKPKHQTETKQENLRSSIGTAQQAMLNAEKSKVTPSRQSFDMRQDTLGKDPSAMNTVYTRQNDRMTSNSRQAQLDPGYRSSVNSLGQLPPSAKPSVSIAKGSNSVFPYRNGGIDRFQSNEYGMGSATTTTTAAPWDNVYAPQKSKTKTATDTQELPPWEVAQTLAPLPAPRIPRPPSLDSNATSVGRSGRPFRDPLPVSDSPASRGEPLPPSRPLPPRRWGAEQVSQMPSPSRWSPDTYYTATTQPPTAGSQPTTMPPTTMLTTTYPPSTGGTPPTEVAPYVAAGGTSGTGIPRPVSATTQRPKRRKYTGPLRIKPVKQGDPPNWAAFDVVEPIDIRYVNDTHVCPSSRARWQDFTVYLETKPRLCMIQIEWNARYKRTPIYHRSWWGTDVEWTYKTVYDPDVKFIDLHGWGEKWKG